MGFRWASSYALRTLAACPEWKVGYKSNYKSNYKSRFNWLRPMSTTLSHRSSLSHYIVNILFSLVLLYVCFNSQQPSPTCPLKRPRFSIICQWLQDAMHAHTVRGTEVRNTENQRDRSGLRRMVGYMDERESSRTGRCSQVAFCCVEIEG